MWDFLTGNLPTVLASSSAVRERSREVMPEIVDLTARVVDLTAMVKEQASELSQYQDRLQELEKRFDENLGRLCNTPNSNQSASSDKRGSEAEAPVDRRSDFNPVYIGRERLLIRTHRGQLLICNAQDVQLTPELAAEGVWEPALTDFYIRNIAAGMTYLEIGANIGYFTVLASTLVGHTGRVHAFEPEPKAFSLLTLNCRTNHCSYLCELIPLAVSNVNRACTLNSFQHNFGSSSLSELPEALLLEFGEQSVPQTVQCTTLDAFYVNRDLVFDFVKIDAEGAEPLIFEGGKSFLSRCTHNATIFAVEYNPQAIKGLNREGTWFINELLGMGYFVWKMSPNGTLQRLERADDVDTWCNSQLILSRKSDAVQPPALRAI